MRITVFELIPAFIAVVAGLLTGFAAWKMGFPLLGACFVGMAAGVCMWALYALAIKKGSTVSFECLKCGSVISSDDKLPVGCKCGNIQLIDPANGESVFLDRSQIRVRSISTTRKRKSGS